MPGSNRRLTAILLVFVMMQAYAPYDKNVTPVVRKFIDRVLIAIGLVYLVYFLTRALMDLGAFLTREHAEDILVGPSVCCLFCLPSRGGRGASSSTYATALCKVLADD